MTFLICGIVFVKNIVNINTCKMFTIRMQFLIKKTIRWRANAFLKAISVFLFINFFSVLESKAQRDIIITQADEEIRCRILDETPTRFIYAYIGPKGKVLRNEIFKNLVKNFNYNQYDSDIVTADIKNGRKRKSKKSTIAIDNSKKGLDKEVDDRAKDKTQNKKDVPENPETLVQGEKDIKKTEVPIFKNDADLTAVKDSKKSKTNNSAIQEQAKKAQVDSKAKKLLADKEIKSQPAQEIKSVSPEKEESVKKVSVNNSLKATNDANEVMAKGDSINSTINDDKDSAVITELKNQEISVVDKKVSEGEIQPKKEVLAQEVKSKEVTPISPEIITDEFKNYLKWRIGVKAGIGNILDNSFIATNAFGLYQEKLLKGWTFGADIAFFPMEGFGLGVVYTDFQSSNTAKNLNFINQVTNAEVSGEIANKISRKFIGPSFFLRKSIDYKTFIVIGVSPGMYYYSDKGNYNGASFDYRGNEIGAAATLGLDFLLGNDIIGRDIILSLAAGYNTGKLKEIDYGDGLGNYLLDKPIIMDRLDFSIGLRFMRFPKYLKK
jgi:hypothetical protein